MRTIVISQEIKEKIEDIQAHHDFRNETGGIIVGIYDTKEMCLRITDFSFPFERDVRRRFRFFRHKEGHQEYMDKLWKESGHIKAYLGEWHTHDQDIPVPSITDKQTWKRIAKQNNNFDQCCFIIIGRKKYQMWTVINDKVVEQMEDVDE